MVEMSFGFGSQGFELTALQLPTNTLLRRVLMKAREIHLSESPDEQLAFVIPLLTRGPNVEFWA
jgi:hypothetical protein